MHGRVDAGEAAFLGQGDDFVYRRHRVHGHAPQRLVQAEEHFIHQGTEIGVDTQVAVSVPPGIDAREEPSHLGDTDAGVAPQQRHQQGGAGALVADDEDRSFFKHDGHGPDSFLCRELG